MGDPSKPVYDYPAGNPGLKLRPLDFGTDDKEKRLEQW
jgi:hypothetical protein